MVVEVNRKEAMKTDLDVRCKKDEADIGDESVRSV
jgi:hypothetical protein